MDPATLAALTKGAGQIAQGLKAPPSTAYQTGSGNLERGSRVFVFGGQNTGDGVRVDSQTLMAGGALALGFAWIVWGQ